MATVTTTDTWSYSPGADDQDTWCGAESPKDPPAVPVDGNFTIEGDTTGVEFLFAGLVTETMPGIADPGFLVHVHVLGGQNSGFNMTFTTVSEDQT